jgi:hypothetical protein
MAGKGLKSKKTVAITATQANFQLQNFAGILN